MQLCETSPHGHKSGAKTATNCSTAALLATRLHQVEDLTALRSSNQSRCQVLQLFLSQKGLRRQRTTPTTAARAVKKTKPSKWLHLVVMEDHRAQIIRLSGGRRKAEQAMNRRAQRAVMVRSAKGCKQRAKITKGATNTSMNSP
jgi:hypothetical protein